MINVPLELDCAAEFTGNRFEIRDAHPVHDIALETLGGPWSRLGNIPDHVKLVGIGAELEAIWSVASDEHIGVEIRNSLILAETEKCLSLEEAWMQLWQ